MLKSLELFGFKSFADRTQFDFDPGITGVVGPNGSGKSNVVDAIKWLLGDQSPKSLRGKEMTDVIFNGAAGRKPSGFAEAVLTFDNSNGRLPVEWQEVQIGRRLYRSGESEYLINGAPARLRDVRELFMGTGVGPSAYCVIEQGRVDEILQANATTRRAIFEEAAGISRYKSRRVEAQRKLERVDQNLQRLTDIVDEVEVQLNSLRSQATKAAKYREVSNELKETWIGLAADDYRHHAARLFEFERRIAANRSQGDELRAQFKQCDERLTELDGDFADLDDRLRETERQHASVRQDIARHEATVRHQTAHKRELEAEQVRLRKQRTVMASRVTEVASEIQHASEQLARQQAEFQQKQAELATHDAERLEWASRIAASREKIEQDRQQLFERMGDISSLTQRISSFEEQLIAADEAVQAARVKLKGIEQKLAACAAGRDKRQQRVAEQTSEVERAQEAVQNILRQRETLIGQQGHFRQSLAEQREQRSAWLARKSLLEDLELRQEGLGIGVKEILSRARSAQRPPWSEILGSVADLFDVDMDQAALLEIALGNRAQLIVIERYDSLLDYLNQGTYEISGRVGFVALENDAEPPQTAPQFVDRFRLGDNLPDLTGRRGVIDRADRLIRVSERLRPLVERLLADTWIVDTLAVAADFAATVGRGCRFVTLQGELVDSDGTLTVGTVCSETAVVSRKSELRQLKHDLVRLGQQISEEEKRLLDLNSSLTDADSELEEAKTELQRQVQRHAELKTELASHDQDFHRLSHERDTACDESARFVQRRDKISADLDDSRMDHARTQEDIRLFQTALEQAERELARSEHRLETLEQKNAADRLELAKHEERLRSLSDGCRRLEQDQLQRLSQRDEAERRYDAGVSKKQQISLHILNTSAVLAELFLTDEQYASRASALARQKEQLRIERTQQSEQIAKLRDSTRALDDVQHRDEMLVREVRFHISALEQRMDEEYQLVLADVVATNVSAMSAYLRDSATVTRPEVSAVASELGALEVAAPQTRAVPSGIPQFEELRAELEERVNRLRKKLKMMGNVNTDSLQNLDELETRFAQLNGQLQDLVEAKNTLEDIVRRINTESKRLFTESFEIVREHFRELFRKAFGGGDGTIVLEDPNDILECGIDIVARPPGKELKSISLLSGGEKTLTAFALLLALFKSRPSAYCLLDEVDAALDEANVGRLLALLEEFKKTTQFIIITHKKPTMTIADTLYGVTMEQSGVSKRMSVRFEDVRENGEFVAGTPESEKKPPSRRHGRDAA